MKDILITWGIAFALLPLVLFASSRHFGKSITGFIGKVTGAMSLFYCALFFTIGKLEHTRINPNLGPVISL